MAFKRKYKFSIIDHLYYAGRIRRIHNRWSMPLVWAAVEVYSKIEKKYFTKARERAYYRLYPERKDKNYFWLQLLLPLGLFLINLGIAYWLCFVYQ